MSLLSGRDLQAGIVISLCLHAALLQSALSPEMGAMADASAWTPGLTPSLIARLSAGPEESGASKTTSPPLHDRPGPNAQQQRVVAPPSQPQEIDETNAGEPTSETAPDYLPAAALARPPVPVSAPAIDRELQGITEIRWDIRLRLYIDADGRVSNVLNDNELIPAELSVALSALFRNTLFIPGNDGQRDVASYIDIAITP